MKVGDTVPVNIGQGVVAQAKIVELGDGTATLIIPATKVVMGVTTQLNTTPVTPTGGTEHAILGVETPDSLPASAANEPVAPVAQNPQVTTTTATVPDDGSTSQSDAVTPAQAPASPQAVETATAEVDTPGVSEVTTTESNG